LLTASSKELEKKIGWKAGKNNIPACYLVGFLAGKKAIKSKINEVILDIGLLDSVKGGKVYAALKGAIDAGLSISHSKEILPNDATLNGSVISNYAKKLSQENKEKYNRVFAGYIKNGIKPEELTKYFEETKKKIN
jgi:large subunit ribosomal protein L18